MFLWGQAARFAAIAADLIRQADEAVLLVGPLGDILYANRGVTILLGYTPAELAGERIDHVLPDSLQADVPGFLGSAATDPQDPPRHRQALMRARDGREIAVMLTVMRARGEAAFAVTIRPLDPALYSQEDLLALVTTDPLTHAVNAREFMAIAGREAQRAGRYNRPLSVLVLDVDNLGKINMMQGVAAGDMVLTRLATVCMGMLRRVDIFARLTGEEFAALLPETDSSGAGIIAERLRKTLEGSVVICDGKQISFTVSIGVTTFRYDEMAADEPLKRARLALAEVQAAGQNAVRSR